MGRTEELKSNIWKYNIFNFVRNAIFMIPILILFFIGHGLNMKQVMILESIFAITVVLFELPTGYFADRVGRKHSVVIGSICVFAAAVIYSLSNGFYGFMVGEIIWGIGVGFCSGADTALIYDTLYELKKKKDYKKVEGHAQFLARSSEAGASLLGGFIAVISPRLAIAATAAVFFFLIPITLSFHEPKRHSRVHNESHIVRIYKIARFALHRNKVIKWLIIYSSLLGLFGVIPYWFSQPYMKSSGLPLAYFGVVFACFSLIAAFGSKYSYLYEKWLGLKMAIISLPVLTVSALFLLGKFVFVLSFLLYFPLEFVRGIEFPLVNNLINRIVWSENRATIISLSNLVYRMMFFILAPFFGWFADLYSIPHAFYFCGAFMFVVGGITLIMMHVHKAV